MKNWNRFVKAVGIAAVLLTFVLVMTAAAKDPSAMLGTVNLYDGSAAITTTTYSNAPYVGGWSNDDLEIFVSARAATTGALTTTVQVSYDNVNWVSLYSDYLDGSSVWSERTYRVVLSGLTTATSADYIIAPVQGLYMRVQMAPHGTITPTIKAVRR